MWVFGLVDTSQTLALGYMEVVLDRTAATLLPIIQAHVAPGTTIYSDEWSVYCRVSFLPSVSSHSTVNHPVHFVDPGTGVHTQHIESYWETAKHKLKHKKGFHLHEVPSYSVERGVHVEGTTPDAAFTNIFQHIAREYPV